MIQGLKKMQPGRLAVLSGQILGLLLTLYIWRGTPEAVAWFTGVVAFFVAVASLLAEEQDAQAAEWVGLLVIVSSLMSVAVSAAAFALEGASSIWAVSAGLVNILLWWMRPRRLS